MAIDERRIEAIVSEVIERLDRGGVPARAKASAPLGVHPDLDHAIAAARRAFEAYDQVALETRKRIVDSQVRKITARGLQKLVRRLPGPPPLGRRVTEKTQDRLVERSGEMHRPAVGTHHAVAQRQRRDQPGKIVRGTREQGKPTAVFGHGPRLVVIPRMLRVVRFAGCPKEQDSC